MYKYEQHDTSKDVKSRSELSDFVFSLWKITRLRFVGQVMIVKPMRRCSLQLLPFGELLLRGDQRRKLLQTAMGIFDRSGAHLLQMPFSFLLVLAVVVVVLGSRILQP